MTQLSIHATKKQKIQRKLEEYQLHEQLRDLWRVAQKLAESATLDSTTQAKLDKGKQFASDIDSIEKVITR